MRYCSRWGARLRRLTTYGGTPQTGYPECDDGRPAYGGVEAEIGAGCWECSGGRDELEEATIFDTSGGAYLQLCRWCRGVFERRDDIYPPTVCVRCGRHSDPSRAEGLKFFDEGDGAEALHICDDCRLQLLGMPSGDKTQAGGVGRCQP